MARPRTFGAGPARSEACMRVKLKFVHEDVDRHGNVRVYFWRKGGRKVRLREPPGSPAFMERYNELVAGDGKATAAAPAIAPNSLRWLMTRYFASHEFGELETSTQRLRRRLLESSAREPLFPGSVQTFAQFPIERLNAKALRVLRDRKAATPGEARNRLSALRVLFAWAVEHELAERNPVRDVKVPAARSGGFHTWTVDEVAQFEARHPAGSKARRALALLLFTGARRSDVIRLGRQHMRDGWMRWRPHKGRKRYPVMVEIPVLPELADELAGAGGLTYLAKDDGQPYNADGFSTWFRRRCNEAGLTHCSSHGLRKAGATIAANNGATPHQLMAIFGWTNTSQAETYTRDASRRTLAASGIDLLRPRARKVPT